MLYQASPSWSCTSSYKFTRWHITPFPESLVMGLGCRFHSSRLLLSGLNRQKSWQLRSSSSSTCINSSTAHLSICEGHPKHLRDHQPLVRTRGTRPRYPCSPPMCTSASGLSTRVGHIGHSIQYRTTSWWTIRERRSCHVLSERIMCLVWLLPHTDTGR